MQHYNAVVKLLKLFNKMRAIIKKSSHAGDKQKEQESSFINNLDRLFDIARRNALNLIKNDKDKQFLILQREVGRPGSAFARVKKGKIEEEPTTEPEPSLESQSATSVFTIDGGDEKPSTSRAFSERSKSKIMTPILAATLDRIGLSDRNAMYVISAVLTSAGLNLGTDKVERLPVLVSSGANVQLLGVPKLSSGTNERQANEDCKSMNTSATECSTSHYKLRKNSAGFHRIGVDKNERILFQQQGGNNVTTDELKQIAVKLKIAQMKTANCNFNFKPIAIVGVNVDK
ncbi:uncharacterized protein LOC134222285 [Armigeres subalbatus]|uniref:uncharacterized protein LOC134222285 n=1 Tax=Armigeres subalbatus TaxID=124917 RepID=UPI002ED482CB